MKIEKENAKEFKKIKHAPKATLVDCVVVAIPRPFVHSSHKEAEEISLLLDSGPSHVTCFGQQNEGEVMVCQVLMCFYPSSASAFLIRRNTQASLLVRRRDT